MKKYFVVSDVHSYYDELRIALENAGGDDNNPNYIFISCGDLCDRGPKPKECLEFVINLYNQNRAIFIRGNHEDLMEEAICRQYFGGHDFHNKTTETAEILTGMSLDKYHDSDILRAMHDNILGNKYINSTINYYELKDYIFVHGGIPTTFRAVEDEQYKDLPKIYWPVKPCYLNNGRTDAGVDDGKEARGSNGMKMGDLGIKEPEKTIVCGHYHTSGGHSNLHNDGKEGLDRVETFFIDPETGKQEPHVNHDIFYDNGIIALDACTAISHQVNILVIEEI